MGIIAAIAVGVGAVSAYQGYEARQDAKEAANRSLEEQKKAQAEQRAMNAQQQAQEQRQQVREERIRRAKIMQSAVNSGANYSSGEAGSIGGLSTQLNSNLGFNAGRAATADAIGVFSQNAANFDMQRQNSLIDAQNWDSMFNLSMNIFSASGGVGAMKKSFK